MAGLPTSEVQLAALYPINHKHQMWEVSPEFDENNRGGASTPTLKYAEIGSLGGAGASDSHTTMLQQQQGQAGLAVGSKLCARDLQHFMTA